MATYDDFSVPKQYFDEVAAPATPAAGTVVVYAKADGLLYSKDDAGAETLVSGGVGGGGGIDSGTSFPGSPTTDDLFHRTDLDEIFFYDGTRWLGIAPIYSYPSLQDALGPFSANGQHLYHAMFGVDFDLWIEKWFVVTNVLTTNDGTKFWTVTLEDSAGNDLGSFNTSADTAGTRTNHETTINALLGTTTPDDLWVQVDTTKTSTPGNIYVIEHFRARRVGA
jgi:hypothetical protein